MGWALRILLVIALVDDSNGKTIEQHAQALSIELNELFNDITQSEQIPKLYTNIGITANRFEPWAELNASANTIREYMEERAKYALDAKISLQAKIWNNRSDVEVNNPNDQNFIRFMNTKTGSDAVYVHSLNPLNNTWIELNATKSMNLTQNANFYNLPSSSEYSAVHLATSIYNRDEAVLNTIEWSDIDSVYRTNRQKTKDLAFQMFCSEKGFMRFYPATSWVWDDIHKLTDLFDCRKTEWYINAATSNKNVIIMIDTSGSIIGQRFEIVKYATEVILETLEHSDKFNIMAFSKEIRFLDACNGTAGLLQATMRNKRALRAVMENVTIGSTVNFTLGLESAFSAMRTAMERGPQCENIIMLITDGAPDSYADKFKELNEDKQIRFFAYLIGEEVTNNGLEREMACTNRGIFGHIHKGEGVERNVQRYIRELTRPTGNQSEHLTLDNAVWSGMYREKLFVRRAEQWSHPNTDNNDYKAVSAKASRKMPKWLLRRSEVRADMLSTIVSFPVVANNTFMGVTAVNVPLVEIYQLATPMMIGGRSYFFMLDQNHFVMQHPQLRALEPCSDDPSRKCHKPNYNNMELHELEIPQDVEKPGFKMDTACNGRDEKRNVLFATKSLDRVYPRNNTYYTECVGTSILGLVVALGDEYRVTTPEFNFYEINTSWVEGANWIVHDSWRYCLVNDTDTELSKAAAFTVYVKFMSNIKEIPEQCKPRRKLVERLLWDLKATVSLDSAWPKKEDKMEKYQAHVVFFATPSGAIRFHNIHLKDFAYRPAWEFTADQKLFNNTDTTTTTKEELHYQHFIKDTNNKAVDDVYYQRAIRNDRHLVFDVNYQSRIWYKEGEKPNPFGVPSYESMLFATYKAIFLDKATLGVAGMEMGYDAFVNITTKHGCQIATEEMWCVLLDEHGYIFYSNQKQVIDYRAFYEADGDRHLAKWFGSINGVSQRAMEKLVDERFFTKYNYIDYQGTSRAGQCKPETKSNSSASPMGWFRSVLRLFVSSVLRLLRSLQSYSVFWFLEDWIAPADAIAVTFFELRETVNCTKSRHYFFANRESKLRGSGPWPLQCCDESCGNNKCKIEMHASFVENTNLLMVWMKQKSKNGTCYQNENCPIRQNSPVSIEWEIVEEAPTCNYSPLNRTNAANGTCPIVDLTVEGTGCKSAPGHLSLVPVIFLVPALYLSLLW